MVVDGVELRSVEVEEDGGVGGELEVSDVICCILSDYSGNGRIV